MPLGCLRTQSSRRVSLGREQLLMSTPLCCRRAMPLAGGRRDWARSNAAGATAAIIARLVIMNLIPSQKSIFEPNWRLRASMASALHHARARTRIARNTTAIVDSSSTSLHSRQPEDAGVLNRGTTSLHPVWTRRMFHVAERRCAPRLRACRISWCHEIQQVAGSLALRQADGGDAPRPDQAGARRSYSTPVARSATANRRTT